MRTFSRLLAGTAPVVMSIALLSAPAMAQDASAEEEQDKAAEEAPASSIVVTGSRISRPNLDSTVPITSIAGDTFFKQAQTNVGDTLNDLPQLRSTFAQQNPGLGIGIAGLNLLDLRGLGTQRTLVLVNGRRHVAADILNNAVSPDIGTIPNDLIERVDIVTGGNSAVYGSDAIAGVVNFVMRKSYDGIQLRAQAGVTEEGFGGNQFISGMYGKNFADGRGNITLHAEYSRTDRVFASNVKAFRTNDNFVVVDSDGGAGIVNGGDGFTDRQFFRNISSSTIHFNGLIPINQRNIANAGLCGNATTANNGAPNTAGPAFNCTFIFNNDGRLVQQTGVRVGTGINPTIIGGNGQTGREGNTVSILPFLERYNFNMLAHFEVSPALDFFFEGKFARVNALGNNAGPSFVQGTGGTVDFRERVRLDNPFLNPADRTTLANLILASGCRTDLQVTCPAGGNLTATDIANINNGSFRVVNSRNLIDVGLRDSRFTRDTWRIVGGARGTFNEDWSYEVALNYGKFEEKTRSEGFIDRQRFALAMDAGRNPTTGQIQCRSQFDPASAVPLVGFAAPAAENAARLAADIAACVPYNPFGSPDNRASVAYFSAPFQTDASLEQFVATAFVSGDLSQLFELPGGPISFAIGGEYREEKAFYEQDAFTTRGFTNAVSIPTFAPPPFEVKEAFGEIRIPVLRDQLIHELTFSGAGRVSKYQGAVGTVYSYNAGVDLAPIEDIRFRANYSRAVRAPNVSETGFPLVPNFSNGFQDPCNPGQRGSGVRAANCAADLGPLLANLTDLTQSLPIVSGSNPNLLVERSDSYTYGVVLKPRFLPGFTLSVDYYDISVDGVIANVGVQTIANQCYDSPTLDNIFCRQFTRFRGPGTGPLGEVPGRILGNSLINAPLNFATRKREGVDVNLDYRRNFGDVSFNTNLIYTHVITNSNFQDPTNPTLETRVLGQLGDPQDEFRWDTDIGIGDVTLGYRMRYIGPMFINTFASFNSINNLPATDIDSFPNEKLDSVMYHDLRMDYNIDTPTGNFLMSVGVDNVLDKGVPAGAGTATGAGTAIYSFRGRSFYASVRARF